MKKLFLFIIAAALCFQAGASDVVLTEPPTALLIHTNVVLNNTVTNLALGATNTVVTNTIFVNTADTLNHSVQWFTTFRGTNTISITAQRTIDGANWITWWSTNYVAYQSPGTLSSTNIDFQFTGAWMAYQYIVVQATTNLGTNSIIINQLDH